MEVQKQLIKSTKSDVIVLFLATLIVCTLVGKGIVSLRDTEHSSLLYATKSAVAKIVSQSSPAMT